MKGYIDVGDIEIAIYNVHLAEKTVNKDMVLNSYYELIELMKDDEYVIVGGDMNSSSISNYMSKAGYKTANNGEFGEFQTSVNHQEGFVDNIFVSPNIDIEYVVVGTERTVGEYSGHYPLTAYLAVKKNVSGVNTDQEFEVGADGFTTEFR